VWTSTTSQAESRKPHLFQPYVAREVQPEVVNTHGGKSVGGRGLAVIVPKRPATKHGFAVFCAFLPCVVPEEHRSVKTDSCEDGELIPASGTTDSAHQHRQLEPQQEMAYNLKENCVNSRPVSGRSH